MRNARLVELQAGTQIGRGLALGKGDEQQGANAVHQQNDAGIDAEQDGHQNGRTEHGKDMLNAQRDHLKQRQFFVDLNNTFVFHRRASFNITLHSVYHANGKTTIYFCRLSRKEGNAGARRRTAGIAVAFRNTA